MNTTAIRQAIKLYQQPVELAGIMAVNATLPAGITDLLRLCASEKLLQIFCDERDIDSEMLYNILTHYIEKVLFKEGNTPYKILGIDLGIGKTGNQQTSIIKLARQHHQLLMKIYHPDKNRSSSSVYYASKISKAYDAIKQSNNEQYASDFDLQKRPYTKPPQSFYQATRRAQLQANRTRNSFFALSAIIVAVLTTTVLLLNQPDSPDLIVRNQISTPVNASVDSLISSVALNDKAVKNFTITSATHAPGQISAKKMQTLLHELETAYEKGEVTKIKPILANTPEMSQQSDAALNSKLETLFHITQQRKMVLYDFTWQNIAGNIQGEGKFLSRFLLSGQDEWQTRTGIATVKAEVKDNKVYITQLEMKDRADQKTD